MEIERKFLVRHLPERVGGLPGQVIRQGYLPMAPTPEKLEVRVRQRGEACFLTIKHGQGLCRAEVELPLTQEQFDGLWPLTAGQQLEKARYEVPWGRWLIELDVYGGTLAGLQIAEIEFASVEDSGAFQPPAFCGREVTEEPAYRNANLARDGWPETAGGSAR